jgi:hypothetical protein
VGVLAEVMARLGVAWVLMLELLTVSKKVVMWELLMGAVLGGIEGPV